MSGWPATGPGGGGVGGGGPPGGGGAYRTVHADSAITSDTGAPRTNQLRSIDIVRGMLAPRPRAPLCPASPRALRAPAYRAVSKSRFCARGAAVVGTSRPTSSMRMSSTQIAPAPDSVAPKAMSAAFAPTSSTIA